MPTLTDADPSAFYLEGGQIGALLIHGFTGSAAEMRLTGHYLNDQGLTVSAPLLPGHGTTADDLYDHRWSDWVDETERALAELQELCDPVFVVGLSMGALLSLNLAAKHKNIAGVVTYAAAIEVSDWRRHLPSFIRYLVRQLPKPEDHWADPEAKERIWSYDTYPTAAAFDFLKTIPQIKDLLQEVECPILVIYSTADPTAMPEGSRVIYDQVSSTDKELVELRESGHVICVDKEWPQVAEQTYQFIKAHMPVEALKDG